MVWEEDYYALVAVNYIEYCKTVLHRFIVKGSLRGTTPYTNCMTTRNSSRLLATLTTLGNCAFEFCLAYNSPAPL